MKANIRGLGLILAGLACCTSSCGTFSQYRLGLEERDAQIRSLRDERAQLKDQLRDQRHQTESLETALAEANMRLVEEPVAIVPAAASLFPDLDEVGVGYSTRNGDLVITIPAQISFGSGKAELSSQGRGALDAVAHTLQGQYADATYWIEGHTDDDPISKSGFANNRELSLARAQAVLTYLVGTARLRDAQFVVAGWGEYRPVASNDGTEGKALNRRVEIIVRKAD